MTSPTTPSWSEIANQEDAWPLWTSLDSGIAQMRNIQYSYQFWAEVFYCIAQEFTPDESRPLLPEDDPAMIRWQTRQDIRSAILREAQRAKDGEAFDEYRGYCH